MFERVEVFGRSISIHSGEGRNDIFYIHGSGSSGKVWANQLKRVGGFAIDLPGHGDSEDADIVSVDDYADFVINAIDKIGGKFFIAGHSLGGAIAQKVYLKKPDIVKGLVLVGSGARLRVLPEILEGLQKDFEKTVRFIVEKLFSPSFKDDDLKKEVFEEMLRCGSRITYRDFKACDEFDLLEDYKSGKINVEKALCIVGKDDVMTPVKYSEFFVKTINAEISVVDGAGHMVMVEKPHDVNMAIKKFCNALDG